MKGYVIALDQGTTSSRAIVFDRAGQIVSIAQYDYPQIYPQMCIRDSPGGGGPPPLQGAGGTW